MNFNIFSEIARAANIRVVRCECSSAFSAKVMQKLGSTKIYTLKYADYKVDGETVFTVEAPHTEVGIYYYRYWGDYGFYKYITL